MEKTLHVHQGNFWSFYVTSYTEEESVTEDLERKLQEYQKQTKKKGLKWYDFCKRL